MIGMSERRGDLPGRYWYPLSLASYGEEEVAAVVDHLTTYRTTMAATTREFETAFAGWQGCDHAVMVNSGSSADLLIALAVTNPAYKRLHQGDVVLVPAVTWPTHAWSLMMAGLKVRLVDVDPATLNVDPAVLEKAITEEVKAISVVHLMGNPCDMGRIYEIAEAYALLLFEDCCEALGSTWAGRAVGTFGLASAFSFFFSHHMTTLEGGMVCTDDAELAALLRVLRNHGWDRSQPGYVFTNWGLNVRPTELAAAIGLVQLRRLEAMNAARVRNGRLFGLTGRGVPFAAPIFHERRDRLASHLEANGVETRPVVAGNLARQPAAKMHGLSTGAFPGADYIHDHGLVVGVHPVDEPSEIDKVMALVREAA